jgi:DMSO/TMAO reductase YedYZ heme-binding membrane subunit
MRIHWPNIFATILALVACVLVIRHETAMATFLGNIHCLGPGHTEDERITGLIAFGLVAFLLIAVLRILNRKH